MASSASKEQDGIFVGKLIDFRLLLFSGVLLFLSGSYFMHRSNF